MVTPRTIQDTFECAFLLGRDAVRLAGDLDAYHRSEVDVYKKSEAHRLRATLLDFSYGMRHVERRFRELGFPNKYRF